MIISASGIVVDHYGDVLLIRRDDTRTLAPPGGAAEIGELPPDAVAREVREETGLIVMAVRLVGLYYLPTWPDNFLTLVFRCIMRGGEIETSEESPQVGFFKINPLPKPMLAIHARRIQQGTAHVGGPPNWETNDLSLSVRLGNRLMHGLIYPWLHFRRRRAGLPVYEPPPDWHARSLVVLRNERGEVLWVRDRQAQTWVLPGGMSTEEPPWETAERALQDYGIQNAALAALSGVYPGEKTPEMTFAFVAKWGGAEFEARQDEMAFFASGEEPLDSREAHASVAAEAGNGDGAVVYRQFEVLPGSAINEHGEGKSASADARG